MEEIVRTPQDEVIKDPIAPPVESPPPQQGSISAEAAASALNIITPNKPDRVDLVTLAAELPQPSANEYLALIKRLVETTKLIRASGDKVAMEKLSKFSAYGLALVGGTRSPENTNARKAFEIVSLSLNELNPVQLLPDQSADKPVPIELKKGAEETDVQERSSLDVLNALGVNMAETMSVHMGMTAEMVQANIQKLKETKIKEEIDNSNEINVKYLSPEGEDIPLDIKAQIASFIARCKDSDPTEFVQIASEGLEIVLLPDSGINRPFIVGKKIFIPRIPYKDGKGSARLAHELSHLLLQLSGDGVQEEGKIARSQSSAISEGAAIFMCDTVYYTNADNPKLHSADVSLAKAIFLETWKVQSMGDALTGKAIAEVPTSPSRLTELLKQEGVSPILDPSYVYGAYLMQEIVNHIGEKGGQNAHDIIKKLHVVSAGKETQKTSGSIEDDQMLKAGLSIDPESKIIVSSLIQSLGIQFEEASIILASAVSKMYTKT